LRAIWADAKPDSFPNPHTNIGPNLYSYSNGITYRYSNANADTDTNAMRGEVYTHTAAASYSTTATLVRRLTNISSSEA
jgi:hypothetical protein